MDVIAVGIDVSKDRLDVAVRPTGDRFAVERNGSGLEQLVAWLGQIAPSIVALEATGGFETVAAAALAGSGMPGISPMGSWKGWAGICGKGGKATLTSLGTVPAYGAVCGAAAG